MELTFNGETYQATSEKLYSSCQGCTTTPSSELCKTISEQVSCNRYRIIWIKKEQTTESKGATMTKESYVSTKKETTEEPKYTVDEVLEVVEFFDYSFFTKGQVLSVKDYLAKQTNPDYQLYLKLKAQFGE